MSQPSSGQEWSDEHQRWLQRQFHEQHQRWYWMHYVAGQWVFFAWIPFDSMADTRPRTDSAAYAGAQSHHAYNGLGPTIVGTYNPGTTQPGIHYERLDHAFYVRSKDFFVPGRVFSVLFTEAAGATVTSYNSSLTYVKYGELAHTQVRRFIVVRQKKAFCYAIPIFTYKNQGTLKPGVEPNEHAIAYSWGEQPSLLQGEAQLSKDPICIVMTDNGEPLHYASRIFFGIHHPIQYNVKVKDLGYVIAAHMQNLIGYWSMENQHTTAQDVDVTAGARSEASG
ncbi:hypothetical protein IQ07DRAFT_564121 [Pyrenochaeta sp. DS3sAY3a]|nr:hypothetical protein IQ07DRAFT_564121 [Pyrenochaeta sp. DS3sAY3a]